MNMEMEKGLIKKEEEDMNQKLNDQINEELGVKWKINLTVDKMYVYKNEKLMQAFDYNYERIIVTDGRVLVLSGDGEILVYSFVYEKLYKIDGKPLCSLETDIVSSQKLISIRENTVVWGADYCFFHRIIVMNAETGMIITYKVYDEEEGTDITKEMEETRRLLNEPKEM